MVLSALTKGPGVRPTSDLLKLYARHRECCRRVALDCALSLDGMPSEILLKIFAYLDAVNLLCVGCVNRRFYHLASDNFIWVRIYSTAFSPKRSNWKVNSVEKTAVSVNLLSLEDKEAGYWKKEYIAKQIASVKATVARLLKPVNPYTGLPVKIKEALRVSGLGWVIILRDKSGKEYITEHVRLSVNDTSVSVVWYGKNWPHLATLSTLDLCGVTPVFMDRYKSPTKTGDVHRPRWRSLIARYSLSDLTETTLMGCDGLIQVFCLSPGLLVGLWKRDEELAFVMTNLHLHQLMERSTLGSATTPYELPPHSPFLDDAPEYGLHGYQLHVDLHSGDISYLCGTFRNLFSKKEYIENGYVKLVVISFDNNTQHVPLIGKVGLSWRTNIFEGCIKSCSVMDVTLLDDSGKPFWCFSSPVCMRPSTSPCDTCDFLGQRYCVDYVDSEGRVHLDLVWIEETKEYFVVNLALYLSVAKINHWFGTEY
ncbi:F-box only protein 15 isoform X2 [Elephas maximus indicus]|uniref:F-box only protein 15 isoform X2 n=1 Tax=Elephas maximus indicus TaxID=99487 RepID=UPI002116E344|nr:F-box only protein 15 isoform X2 [Elephas maximus indicus]